MAQACLLCHAMAFSYSEVTIEIQHNKHKEGQTLIGF